MSSFNNFKTFSVPVTFSPVTSPVCQTFAALALVQRALQLDFSTIYYGQQQVFQLGVVNSQQYMLLFPCYWFQYRYTKFYFVIVEKFGFVFVSYLVAQLITSMLTLARAQPLNHALRDAQNVHAGTVHKELSHDIFGLFWPYAKLPSN